MLRLLLIFALAQLSVAQTTWDGLRFKMSEEDVKKQMSAQGFELHPVANDRGHYTATPDYDLMLPDLRITLPFIPELNFGTSGMSVITLSLDTAKFLTDNPRLDPMSMTLISAKSIHDALVTRYGQPLEQSGSCNKVDVPTLLGDRGIVECKTKWRGEAQLVMVSWYYHRGEKKFEYFLQYQAQASGL